MRRLNIERQRPSASGGAGPLTNQQRSQSAGQPHSPRVTTKNNMNIAGDNGCQAQKQRRDNRVAEGPAARALAALEESDSDSDEDRELGRENPSRLMPPKPNDTSRVPAQELTRGQELDDDASDASEDPSDNDHDSHRAMLERRLDNYRKRSSPGSVASGKHVARRLSSNGVSPYRYSQGDTKGGTRVLKSEMGSPREQGISRASGDNAQSGPGGVIDLTIDTSDDDVEVVKVVVPPVQGKSEGKAANHSAQPRSSSKGQSEEEKVGVKPKAAPEKSAATSKKNASKKAPATKAVSCSLTGTLQLSEKEGVRCHVIRGLWQYEKLESTPERFILQREIPSGSDQVPLTAGGIFSGSFIFQWGPKGHPNTSLVINEIEVTIEFSLRDNESDSFDMRGTGRNDIGRFDLVGVAWKTASEESYNIQMRKTYTEHFQSRVPQPETEEDDEAALANGRKRKFSAVDEGSEAARSNGEGKQSSSEGSVPRATSTSNSSQESDFDEVSGNNKSSSGKLVLEQTKLGATAEAERGLNDPKSLLLSPSEYLPPTGASEENDGSLRGSWREFGALSSAKNTQAPTWTVRNVTPNYSPMILDFFDSVGIVYVQDILSADTEQLCSKLLAFGGFKAGCAFAAWRGCITGPPNRKKNFRDWYTPNFATKNILRWKDGASAWYKKMAPSEPTSEVETAVALEAQDGSPATDNGSAEKSKGSANMEVEEIDDSAPLETILSSYEADALKNHCNITTAASLLKADRSGIASRLAEFVSSKFRGRPENDLRCIAEGMVYSWMLRAEEALQSSESASAKMSSESAGEDASDGCMILSRQSSAAACQFETPLSYVDLQFIKSQRITSDEELAESDPSLLARGYAAYLEKTFKHIISSAVASEVTNKWRQDASLVVGLTSREEICDSLPPQETRLDPEYSGDVMNCIPNLCKTVLDDENGGLPQKTIFAYDGENHVLYEFLATAKDSLVAADAGKGCFLTYRGAKVLKSSSKWKIKRKIPRSSQTRKPLEAVFPISGATVSLTGANLHADEVYYGPERDDSVGYYREFTLDDFVDDENNITFSSSHLGCALIELDRYAPLLPEDRKTDLVFGLKDFIFSYEPSSWRFDVTETLRGHDQVVDFTDDTTGAPHVVAQRHMAKYVNEVGHNMNLVENVRSLATSRSVTYYVQIDKPMARGDTMELLVNYKEGYETMRERRGYGKANLFHGVKSDDHDITRLQRNLKDRCLVEDCIRRLPEDDVHELISFFKTRVLDGLNAATSTFASQDQNPNLLRQCIARRRMHWLSLILRKRFYELLGSGGASAMGLLDGSGASTSIWKMGMPVYVHDWPQDNPRPPYTGLATITAIRQDKFGRDEFEVMCSNSTYIESVPEAVVTVPTEDDFEDAPSRTYAHWLKWKKNNEELPQRRQKMLRDIDIDWEPSFLQNIPAASQTKVAEALRWELSEELLHLLLQNKRLSRPFDEEMWCPAADSLLVKGLHLISDCLLMGKEKQGLCNELMGLARDSADAITNVISGNADQRSLDDLAFLRKSEDGSSERVVVLASLQRNRMAIEDYSKDPKPLDLEWYLTEQVILVVHPLATLIDWGSSPIYSLEKLRDCIGLQDASYLNFYTPKVSAHRPLLSLACE